MVARKALPYRSVAPDSSADGGGFTADDIPAVLRPGSNPNASPETNQNANFEAEEESVWRQPEWQPATVSGGPQTGQSPPAGNGETNPFKRKILAAPDASSSSSSSTAPKHPPRVPLPPPSSSLAQLSLNESGNNPWQPALPNSSGKSSPAPPVSMPDVKNVWVASEGNSERPSRQPSTSGTREQLSEANLAQLSDTEGDNAGWDEIASPRPVAAASAVRINPAGEAAGEGWNFVDVQGSAVPGPPAPGQLSRQSTWENFTDDEDGTAGPKAEETANTTAKGKSTENNTSGPVAPEPVSGILIQIDSPTDQEGPKIQDSQSGQDKQGNQDCPIAGPAPGEVATTTNKCSEELPQAPTHGRRDKTGTYQIKNISWHDARAAKNPRISPILLQNANGPCPLVALVNVLTLTTPAETSTALVETLRTREQVSLSLLLDAVFDELISARRGESEHELPDLGELYEFLKSLHTGMNVNPRFIPTPDVVAAFRRSSLTHLHPTERDGAIPGSFEYTREMKLYSTFGIPLIHGWLPAPTEGVYGALSRNAESYEDVQNLLFREEELEDRLSSPTNDGLTEEEQHLFHDILEIKTFLHVSATQLTQYGIDVLRKAMMPGSFAILFRNDHFSTLYRHPDTMQLMSLVTDAGYATHDEVIWETLVDVNGEHSDFYSGDFRLVGGLGGSGQQQGNQRRGSAAAAAGSSGAGSSAGNGTEVGRSDPTSGPGPDYEQEDRDLALALQLQEEEEERHRSEAERRRRESQLSEQFIEQEARQPNSVSPVPRPSNAAGGGRYSSGYPALATPRRSSAGASGGTPEPGSTLGNAASHGRTTSASSLQPQRQPALPPRRSQQQVVRPLVPPLDARPATHRPADPEDGDEAPPSYEQAAKQAPYHPPSGAPGSGNAGGSLNTASARPRPGMPMAGGRPFVMPNTGVYSPQPLRPQQQAPLNRERDCVVM